MSTIARPGTPFPSSHPSLPPFTHRRTTNPLHFTISPMPSRTPPSLLKRSASSATSSTAKYPRYTSSSSSSSGSPRSPVLISHSERRESTSSNCSSCSSSSSRLSPVLSTPTLNPTAHIEDVDIEILLDTPSEQYSTLADYSIPKAAPTSPSRPKLIRGAAVPLPPSTSSLPTRPKLTRRDTPRPSPQYEMFSMFEARGGQKRQGSYTSIVDGGKWVAV